MSSFTSFSLARRWQLLLSISVLVAGCGGDDKKDDPQPSSQPTGKISSATISVNPQLQEYDLAVGRPVTKIAGFAGTRLRSGEYFFLRETWTTDEVHLSSADGTTSTKLFDANCSNGLTYPQVNNAGDRFALTAYYRCTAIPGAPQYGTFILNRSGAIVARYDSLYEGTFAPDGRLVFTGCIDEGTFGAPILPTASRGEGLFITPAGGGRARKMPVAVDKPLFPAVSPDGTKVAFTYNEHIWTVGLDGSGLRQVTSGARSETYPAWSPDGKYIACLVYGTFAGSPYQVTAVVPSGATTEMTDAAQIWLQDSNSTANGMVVAEGPLTWR